jgi:hypothetical protein
MEIEMFAVDLLLSFLLMSLLFVRQVQILKKPNKINYAPLMLGIGAIGSLIHFIINPQVSDSMLLLRESLLPLLVALLFYMIMNILHQTQESQNAKEKDEYSQTLINQVEELKVFVTDLESRMLLFSKEEHQAQEEIRDKFTQDVKILEKIEQNQKKFLLKFEDVGAWHEGVSKEFENFREMQMPKLDDLVHEHIDILRVAEQDHYNQLKKILEKAVENRTDIAEEVESIKENIVSMKGLSEDIAHSITKHTLQQLSDVTNAFKGEIITLKSHTEGVKTSLLEGENTLGGIKVQSEMIMKQMVLSSKKMKELKEQNDGLYDFYKMTKDLILEVDSIKSDYIKSQAQLSFIANELKVSENEALASMKVEIESLSEILTKKIDDSLEQLHEHYHIAEDDITQSVQMLTQKAKLQSKYTELDS